MINLTPPTQKKIVATQQNKKKTTNEHPKKTKSTYTEGPEKLLPPWCIVYQTTLAYTLNTYL